MVTRRQKPEISPPTTPPVVDGLIDWPAETDEPEGEQTTVDRVIGMLANSAGADRAYVRVSRVVSGKVEFCTKYSVADFEAGDLAMIRDHWGPGEYQLQVYGVHPGSNRFGILTRDTVLVAAPRSPMLAAAASPVSDITAFMQQMAESQRDMLRALTERPAHDPMASMKETLAMMTMFREAMGAGAAAPAKSNLLEIVEAVRTLRDISGEINPPAEKAGPMEMVKEMLPLLQAAVAARQQQPVPVPPPAPITYPTLPNAAPVPAAPVLASQPEPESTDVNAISIIQLRVHLANLVKMASENGPIDAAAQLVYEKLPDPIIDVMGGEKWFDEFVQVAPEAKPFEAWFQQVRTAALALFETDDDAS